MPGDRLLPVDHSNRWRTEYHRISTAWALTTYADKSAPSYALLYEINLEFNLLWHYFDSVLPSYFNRFSQFLFIKQII